MTLVRKVGTLIVQFHWQTSQQRMGCTLLLLPQKIFLGCKLPEACSQNLCSQCCKHSQPSRESKCGQMSWNRTEQGKQGILQSPLVQMCPLCNCRVRLCPLNSCAHSDISGSSNDQMHLHPDCKFQGNRERRRLAPCLLGCLYPCLCPQRNRNRGCKWNNSADSRFQL